MLKRGLGIVLLVLMGSACVYMTVVGWTNRIVQPFTLAQGLNLPIQKTAVMPFFRGKRPEDVAEMVNCPLERLGVKEVFKKFLISTNFSPFLMPAIEIFFKGRIRTLWTAFL